ncbi:hypothetical protein Esti_003192 [Eimeria stiedai]
MCWFAHACERATSGSPVSADVSWLNIHLETYGHQVDGSGDNEVTADTPSTPSNFSSGFHGGDGFVASMLQLGTQRTQVEKRLNVKGEEITDLTEGDIEDRKAGAAEQITQGQTQHGASNPEPISVKNAARKGSKADTVETHTAVNLANGMKSFGEAASEFRVALVAGLSSTLADFGIEYSFPVKRVSEYLSRHRSSSTMGLERPNAGATCSRENARQQRAVAKELSAWTLPASFPLGVCPFPRGGSGKITSIVQVANVIPRWVGEKAFAGTFQIPCKADKEPLVITRSCNTQACEDCSVFLEKPGFGRATRAWIFFLPALEGDPLEVAAPKGMKTSTTPLRLVNLANSALGRIHSFRRSYRSPLPHRPRRIPPLQMMEGLETHLAAACTRQNLLEASNGAKLASRNIPKACSLRGCN